MTIKHRPRIGLRSALVALIVASVVPFGLLLHFTWWRTATKVSHDLVDTLERQITELGPAHLVGPGAGGAGPVAGGQRSGGGTRRTAERGARPRRVRGVIAGVVLGAAHTERGRDSGPAGARTAPHAPVPHRPRRPRHRDRRSRAATPRASPLRRPPARALRSSASPGSPRRAAGAKPAGSRCRKRPTARIAPWPMSTPRAARRSSS